MGSFIRAIGDRVARRLASAYFEVSYRLLASAVGREFLRRSAGQGAPAVHGYSSSADIDALLESLRPSATDLLVDLGCGFGEVAIAVHERTGCRVIGVDAAPRAVREARRRAAEVGASEAVRFRVADLGSPPAGASSAYALDSIMFAPRPPAVLAGAARRLELPGRVFVSFVDHRGLDREAFVRYVEDDGLRLERLDDVTAAFRERSRRRAAVARRLLRSRPASAGSLGLLLVTVEEAIVSRLVERGRLRRWRFAAVGGSTRSQVGVDGTRSAP